MREVYIKFLQELELPFIEQEDGVIVMDEKTITIYVDLRKEIDVRILYKLHLSEEEKEKYKKASMGRIEYYPSDQGIWFHRYPVPFEAVSEDQLPERVEYYIEKIETMIFLILGNIKKCN